MCKQASKHKLTPYKIDKKEKLKFMKRMRWGWLTKWNWSWFKVPVKVEQMNAYLFLRHYQDQ